MEFVPLTTIKMANQTPFNIALTPSEQLSVLKELIILRQIFLDLHMNPQSEEMHKFLHSVQKTFKMAGFNV